RAGAVVAVQVGALQPRDGGAAVDVAAHQRAALVATVLPDGQGQPARAAAPRAREAVPPLHAVPAVVLAAVAGGRLEVDLLVAVLADVADVQVAGAAVEAVAPRVA